jgi:hypothetical protein
VSGGHKRSSAIPYISLASTVSGKQKKQILHDKQHNYLKHFAMIKQFKDEFHIMLREQIGYYPWLKDRSYRLERLIYGNRHCPCDGDRNDRKIIREIIEEQVCENKLIDLLYKSLIRSEIRFIHRYIPQGSHEERLTGSLVSEISNSIELIKDLFKTTSIEEYGVEKQIDFFYYDMSKGGKLESLTGADLAIGFSVDLPDYPKIFKSFVFQAKKINSSSQLDLNQYITLVKNFSKNSAYLFFDTDFKTLTCPFVLTTDDSTIKNNAEEANKKVTKSFSINKSDIYDGLPLSSFIIFSLLENLDKGQIHHSMTSLIDSFRYSNKNIEFNGRLAIFSIGKPFSYSINNDGGLQFNE